MKESKKKAAAKATPVEGAPNLSREIIGEAALAIIDRDGLDGFTVRNLASALGVFPGSIYWYIPSKSALFGEALNAFNKQMSLKRGRKSWQAALRDLLGEMRKAIARHPNIAPLISAKIVSNAREDLSVPEYILSVLVSAGFKDDGLIAAYNTTVCSMVGFATLEFAAAPTSEQSKWQLEVQGRLLDLDPERFPLLAGNVRRLANKAFILRWENGVEAPLTTAFDFYVDTMILGLEAQLSAAKAT